MRSTFISWTRYDRHSDLLAQHFGATMHHVIRGKPGRLRHAPVRYARQAAETLQILSRERPDTIFIQNPPIVAVLIGFLYAQRFGARYVVDSHTAAFLSPKWRWSLGLHRMLSRRAVTTIVTNEALGKVVRGWGCHTSIMGFTPGNYPVGEPFPLGDGFNVAVINTGAEDEPLDIVFSAASQLPDVNVYVTGAVERLPRQLLATKSSNVRLTGYLPYESYVSLLRGVDFVVDLTTRDHTLLLGAYEAVSVGTPMIISDWPVLREYFGRGAVYVLNTVDGIRDGLLRARQDRDTLRQEILLLREDLQAEWDRKFSELKTVLSGA